MSAQIFLIGVTLTVAVLVGRLLASRLRIPEAAAYVLIGVSAGLVPGVPEIRLSPELVLLLFLPPLIHYTAFFSDPRETVQHIVPVIGQAVGLVLVTAVAAAAVLVFALPDVGWAAALALGAAIAPPDPVAATNVLHRIGVPRRLVTVLEGEGLINDGVALTLFSLALANLGALPSVGTAVLQILVEVGGGIGIGLVVGFVVTTARKHIRDGPSQVVLSLATPYLAFLPAQLVHSSGVLATVAAAVWLATRGRGLVAPSSRVETETFWAVLNTMLVALLFVLLGLQVPAIIAAIGGYPAGVVALITVALVLVVILTRLGWALFVPSMTARLRTGKKHRPTLSRAERAVLGWCGPRGAVSLAVALSIPLTTASGGPFPRRDLLLFLTVAVVLATVVGQVVSLPALVRRLRVGPDERERTEGTRARRTLVDAALAQLDEMAAQSVRDSPAAEAYRQVLELRRERLTGDLRAESGEDAPNRPPEDQRLRLWLMYSEREALRGLYERGEITTRTFVELSQELDLDEIRLRDFG